MNLKIKLLVFSALISLAACNQSKPKISDEDGLAAFNADSLKLHVAELSHDSLQGRKPFTPGETKTIAYLQKQFKAAGLEPGNGESYIQEVPMVNIQTTAAADMQVTTSKGSFKLKGFDDYVIWTDKITDKVSFDNDEVVFAGYGVVAPDYNWNDYAGLDVKGKIVMVMVNDPGFAAGDSSLFKGKTMTYYGRWTYKYEEAARQGAKGCLIVHTTEGASYPFTVVQNNWNASKLRLDDRGKSNVYTDINGWLSLPAAKKLVAAAGQDSTNFFAQADKKGFKPLALDLKLSTRVAVKTIFNKSQNVIGKITGTKRPDEVIIYTSHWDHLGIGKPDETADSIYNGAFDNASGTAGLIELARAFKSMKVQPERTIILLAVTAEEQGLWGSAYYAQNPIYPTSKTVANINIDGLNPFGKTKDIIIVGEGQSELEEYLKEAAEKAGRVIAFENHPEAGYYYRSDHFNFAKVGVPALYTSNGIDVIGKEPGYGEKQDAEYTEKHYHRPSDEFDSATWTFEGGLDDLKLFFQVGKRLAFEEKMPQWKNGSEFKAIREKK
ncbi:MAG: peptidase M28 [Sphingobacteriales bacterium 17-39-43]|uniref:M28 family metallopeptidase n=1 Tax=Daejeonella sp. TaxID=2805397 RepID=UPI000BD6A188|nr:M28 family metallopeptidase [Daejeonella sp.]OYZ31045.1 MAG: peptidase M28 [Sphingobacteriales bacterium 16-39-50]OZA23886.1 MAG: peptidase M28 [Sphingobacteriales bacterium 17-39-43]HQS05850.1 M28 family metallopeptidase [Daejeonella sp.]HQT23359.1 M28 family metallopeptidase [Daejeonella sp.]HQT58311.1 M28 family metallopeptidase [Daejeonella sp.]